jgi:hypothetical protein
MVPVYRITISLEDRQQINVYVGKATATGSGYYVRLGEKDVSVVSKYNLDSILNLSQNPPIKSTPTPLVETETLPAEIITPTTPIATSASTSSP